MSYIVARRLAVTLLWAGPIYPILLFRHGLKVLSSFFSPLDLVIDEEEGGVASGYWLPSVEAAMTEMERIVCIAQLPCFTGNMYSVHRSRGNEDTAGMTVL